MAGESDLGFLDAPKSVSFESVFPASGKKIRAGDALAGVYKLVFSLPKHLDENLSFWDINDKDARALGLRTEACLANIPTSKKKEIDRFVGKYLPWIGLLGTAFLITYPRIKLTAEISQHYATGTKPALAPSAAQNGVTEAVGGQRPSPPIDYGSTGLRV